MTEPVQAPLDPAFVEALRAEREGLNARFAARRLAGTVLDGAALLEHVRASVAPLISAVHAVAPARVREVLVTLYDVSLDLLAASLVGPLRRHDQVIAAWARTLPAAARWLAEDPLKTAGSVTNAVCRLAGQRGARPGEWIARMTTLAPACASLSEWLECGKIAAWMAGMVQYRGAALRAASALPASAAAAALGLPSDTSAAALATVLGRMGANPWLRAEAALAPAPADAPPARVGSVGAFRGLGGEFLRPPTVRAVGTQLLVYEGESAWRLFADAYGAWLGRVAAPPPASLAAGPGDVRLAPDGTVRWGGTSKRFGELAGASSSASDGRTLAVALPTSHHLFLVGRTEIAP